jgi:putative flavoprotein involved in K+ transport
MAAAEATGGTTSPRIGPAGLDALVIGAGQAGLAAGYHLRRAGLSFAILEAGEEPGGSWPGYYESLTLFSPSRYSGLPGMPFPGPPDRYPTRDEVTAYLRRYAEVFGLPVLTGERVLRAERAGAGFRVLTTAGGEYRARTLIAATGSFSKPHRPRFPNQGAFRGRILHAAEYRNAEPFRGKRVVVVGAGDSAMHIAHELAGVAETTLAARAPIRFVPQVVLGRDLHFWLSVSGLDRLPLGRLFDVSEPAGVVDDGIYAAAVRAGRPDRRPVFSRFTEEGVVWDDGEEEAVDAVVLATGYRPNLDYLRPLGVLREDGRPYQRAGIARSIPGLYFVGLPFQISFASATLRGVGPDAALVVSHARRFVARRTPATVERDDSFRAKMARAVGLKGGNPIAFGHTHKPWRRVVEGVGFVDTGSVGKPKDGDWRAGRITRPADPAEPAEVP